MKPTTIAYARRQQFRCEKGREMKEWMKEEIAKHIDNNGDIEPPWARFPDYTRYSIGWRMGAGESWMDMWLAWLETLPTDLATRRAYLERYPAAPFNWSTLVQSVLSPDDDNGDALNGDISTKQLVAWGLVAHDVAFSSWQRHILECAEGLAKAHKTPNLAARYSTRALGFLMRYGVEKREAGEFEEWFVTLPTFHEEWSKLFHAWSLGVPRYFPKLEKGYRRLIFEMAVFGEARPPWLFDLEPDTYTDDIEMSIDYTDAWALWLDNAFDDFQSLYAYFERYGGLPEEWDEVVDELSSDLPYGS